MNNNRHTQKVSTHKKLITLLLAVAMILSITATAIPKATYGLALGDEAPIVTIQPDGLLKIEFDEPSDASSDKETKPAGEISSSALNPDLEELALGADCIVVGTVIDIARRMDRGHGDISTLVTLSAEEWLKGSSAEEIVIIVPEPQVEEGQEPSPTALRFRIGENTLLFLESCDASTFTVNGGSNGKYTIQDGEVLQLDLPVLVIKTQIYNILTSHGVPASPLDMAMSVASQNISAPLALQAMPPEEQPEPSPLNGRVTIMTETFEGAFPGSWWVFDNNGDPLTEYYWDDDDYKPHWGGWSAWCANGGTDGLDPEYYNYPNDFQAWMVYGPVDLSDATDASLDFYYWNESELNYDLFQWMASINGANFYGYSVSGNSGGWQYQSFDLTSVPTLGNLCGEPQVWIAFIFDSDYIIVDDGAFVDDIELWKYEPDTGHMDVRGYNNDDDAHDVNIYIDGGYEETVYGVPPGGGYYETAYWYEVSEGSHNAEIEWYDDDDGQWHYNDTDVYVGSGGYVTAWLDLYLVTGWMDVRGYNYDDDTVDIAMYIDGLLLETAWGVPPGGYYELSFWHEVTEGWHTAEILWYDPDPGCGWIGKSTDVYVGIGEYVSAMLDVDYCDEPEWPDLIVEDIWTESASFAPGDPVRIGANFCNIGTMPATTPYRTEIYLDGSLIGFDAVAPTLNPGECYWLLSAPINWPADCDPHEARAVVDADDVIPESNEGNNDLGEWFSATCIDPDIRVEPTHLDFPCQTPASTNSSNVDADADAEADKSSLTHQAYEQSAREKHASKDHAIRSMQIVNQGACGQNSANGQPSQIGMVDPAAVYCNLMDYEYKTVETDGGMTGICVLPNDEECDAWDFYGGQCGTEYSYCAQMDWSVAEVGNSDSFAKQCTTCILPNGSRQTVSELLNLTERCTVGTNNFSDSGDYDIAVGETDSTLPDHFDWRNEGGENWITPVGNQGGCGGCWAFSAVGITEAQYNIAYGDPDLDLDLSEQFLVSDCYPDDNCCGGWKDQALEYIMNDGIPDEACFPFVDEISCSCSDGTCDTNCNYRIGGSCSDATCSDRCADWSSRLTTIDETGSVANNIETIKQALVEKGPLAVSFGWGSNYGGWFDGDIYRCTSDTGRNHAVVLAGYDETEDYWILKNSWGSSWDDDGYFKMGYGECLIESRVNYATVASPSDCQVATVHNDGAGQLEVSNIAIDYQPGEPTGWLSASPTAFVVAPASSLPVNVCVDRTSLDEGTYHGWLDIYSNDPDENPIRVTVTLQVCDSDLPDLIVEDVWTEPAEFCPSDPVTVGASFCNIGTVPATTPYRTEIYLDGSLISFDAVAPTLNPGECYQLFHPMDWPGDSDPHEVSAVVDVYDVIPESNEGNNDLGEWFSATICGEPDLIVEDIWTEPAEFCTGDTVDIYTSVRNIGDADAGTFTTQFNLDGSPIDFITTFGGLAAGASANMHVSQTWPEDFDVHAVSVVTDVYDDVSESNEGNNEGEAWFSVTCTPMLCWGDVTLNGAPAPVDTTIDIYIGADATSSGSGTVTVPGEYGSIPVAADSSRYGEALTYKVNGCVAEKLGPDPGVFGLANQVVNLAASCQQFAIRHLPSCAQPEGTYDVVVTFTAPDDAFNSIGLTDNVPTGWTIQVNTGWCTPSADASTIAGDQAQYAWYGPYNAGQEFTALYKVTIPPSTPLGCYPFVGEVGYKIASSDFIFTSIGGDSCQEVCEGIPVIGVTREANCEILGDVEIWLNGEGHIVGPVYSDGDGNYEIYAPEAGTYTICASKSGFKEQCETIIVGEAGPITFDFIATYGLIPCAPDIWYALECVNKWKYPEPPCGLDIWKALEVVNAWLYPGCP